MTTSTEYTPDKLQRMLADVITNRFPLADVTLLLRAGADADGPVTRGLRPLHYAAYENDVEVAELLIAEGADVNAADDLGYTPLHVATKHGHVEAVRCLLNLGAAVNYGFDDCDSDCLPSTYTASTRSINLTTSSAATNTVSSGELTEQPLQLAVENDRRDCTELLLRRGADPNRRYFLGRPINLVPLHHVDCLELLLRYGADPDSFSRGGVTALMSAAKQHNIEAARILLRYGADVNIQCPPRFDRRRAIDFAVMVGSSAVTEMLLDAGASLSLAAGYSLTPLDSAVVHDRPDVCRLLLSFHADPNEVNADGCCALQLAASTSSMKHQKLIMEMLLLAGALPNFSSRLFSYVGPSLSPLVEYLTYCENYDYTLVRLLLQFGARVSFRPPTRLLKIRHPAGILSQLRKLRPHDDLLSLLADAAEGFDAEALGRDSMLSNRQRQMLLVCARNARSLRQLARLAVSAALVMPSGPSFIDRLPLPSYLKQYLLYNVG